MNRSLQISDTVATVDNPYIIAEMGTNHDRELRTATALIDAAAGAGVNAVKYQIFHGEDIVTDTIPPAEYGLHEYFDESSITQIYNNHLRLPRKWFPELVDYANERGIDNIATVSCADCAKYAINSGVDALKIASMDLTHIPLLKHLATYDIPIIISTGLGHLGEISDAISCLREGGHEQHAILHCISEYPTDPADLNLRNIRTIGTAFDIPVGFSDHSVSPLTPALAVAHGASIIEKHFTLSRERSGPEHSFALEPAELARMVQAVELSSKSTGSDSIAVPDFANRDRYRRSIVSDCAIDVGEMITRHKIRFARPGTGIEPAMFEQIDGCKASKNIAAETLIQWDDLI